MIERIAIVGSRAYTRPDLVRAYVRELPLGTVVVSGGARGVDKCAADEARACGLEVDEIRPDYATFGRAAPLRRNTVISWSCTRLVAFWDGKSRGTEDVMRKARGRGKAVLVIGPDGVQKG